MNEHDCQPLLDEIHKFYEDLDMKVWQDIPVYMLDKTKMNVSAVHFICTIVSL